MEKWMFHNGQGSRTSESPRADDETENEGEACALMQTEHRFQESVTCHPHPLCCPAGF